MKQFYLLLLAVAVSTGAFAQMQVWSNGTIIFSHDQSSVDSISFGSPIHVQTNMQAATAVSSLAGSVYVSSLSGAGGTTSEQNGLYTLCFLDDTNGYYSYNSNGNPRGAHNSLVAFTYSIYGSDITITMDDVSRTGKLIGKNAILIYQWFYTGGSEYLPATFLNYNR